MVWIALNLKTTDKDNVIIHNKYYVNIDDKLRELGVKTLPAIHHKGKVIKGTSVCLKYIDYNFGKKKNVFIP